MENIFISIYFATLFQSVSFGIFMFYILEHGFTYPSILIKFEKSILKYIEDSIINPIAEFALKSPFAIDFDRGMDRDIVVRPSYSAAMSLCVGSPLKETTVAQIPHLTDDLCEPAQFFAFTEADFEEQLKLRKDISFMQCQIKQLYRIVQEQNKCIEACTKPIKRDIITF